MKTLHYPLVFLLSLIAFTTQAQSGRLDYDLDDDGLIEINTLADLNEIRHNLTGTSLYGSKAGCPAAGCHGFELTTNLDFDTNGDGVINANDDYWNAGQGWVPIGSDTTGLFTATFEGNGHVIRNLMINRPSSAYQGLFGYARKATLRHLGLSGPLMTVTGSRYVGGLAGYFTQGSILGSYATGRVNSTDTGWCYAGGLVGHFSTSDMKASFSGGIVKAVGISVGGLVGEGSSATLDGVFSTASVEGSIYVGGLGGYFVSSTAKNAYAVGRITASSSGGGLFGYAGSGVSQSYWAVDSSTLSSSSGGGLGVTLAQLQCPAVADNTSCRPSSTLFAGWGDLTDEQGNAYWDFGNANQLPGLNIKGVTYRDSDGDGYLDSDDSWPELYAAGLDKDGDGFPDAWTLGCDSACQIASGLILDQFPHHVAASIDLDLDGLPDAWNTGCDLSCQNASGLTLDLYPGDTDNDGIPDDLDTDDGNDGQVDADADSNGLVDIYTLAQLNTVRYNLAGTGRRLTQAGPEDSSGCPARLVEGRLQQACYGYELKADLDFDTNGDGVINANDDYWNAGEGWVPIGSSSSPFAATFEGNGHVIRNLMINRPSSSYQGLFGYAQKATVRHLGLTGPLMTVTGRNYVGSLAGDFSEGSILGSYATGRVNSTDSLISRTGGLIGYFGASDMKASFSGGIVKAVGISVGGLVGEGSSATLDGVFSTASVEGSIYVGGLGGYFVSSTAKNAYAVGRITASSSGGGLFGYAGSGVSQSYWAVDSSTLSSSSGGGLGVTLAQLQCPTVADNTSCRPSSTLFAGWGDLTDEQGNAYWDFGNANQLPGLNIKGVTYRDSDGDGYLDSDDPWPELYAAGLDSDGDGFPDAWTLGCDSACQSASGLTLDQFPHHAAASIDLDLDGLPDAWNTGCDLSCQNASGLTLDLYPGDTDNDGIPDDLDTDDGNDGQVDADADSNGLIDIYTLAQLNAVRYNLAGTGRRLTEAGPEDSSGCPVRLVEGRLQQTCYGYELKVDLDFDTNGDGVINANDDYWNAGEGWVPIGSSSNPFAATFEGNGHVIRNLMINRPSISYQGLFGYARNATVRHVGLSGPLMTVTGSRYVGGLAGYFTQGSILGSYATGRVNSTDTGWCYAGGLVGHFSTSDMKASFSGGIVKAVGISVGGLVGEGSSATLDGVFSTASVEGSNYIGGLGGYFSSSTAKNAYASGGIAASSSKGGLFGYAGSGVSQSYWAVDSSTLSSSSGGGLGVTLTQLQCPTAADNISCHPSSTLFAGWGDLTDEQGNAYWDFGNANQLPGLNIKGVTYRDSDGDGYLDSDDTWPELYAAGLDSDGDGFPDAWTLGCDSACQSASGLTLDQFPHHAAASIDLDLDGLPDAWNTGCDLSCQNASGLTLDLYPGDTDNDGIPDDLDTDDGNDGQVDADADSNGLIDIYTLAQLNTVRYNLAGTGRRLTQAGPEDSSGCPARLVEGRLQQACYGYELKADLDFDTNGDGVINANDDYWNAGEGWVPIGSSSSPFAATFEGNGHVIRNLMINRPSSSYQGLFGYAQKATVRHLGLTGPLMTVTGRNYVGSLAGDFSEGSILGSYATGRVNSTDTGGCYAGGLVGYFSVSDMKASFSGGIVKAGGSRVGGLVGDGSNATLNGVFSTASVEGFDYVGGLGGFFSSSTVKNAYAVGRITASGPRGGLFGYAGSGVSQSYWAVDSSTLSSSSGGGLGVTLAQLQCPTVADNTSCRPSSTLFAGWGDLTDEQGNAYWDFGNPTQLPALKLKGVNYRDTDLDGIFDHEDEDIDGDGILNTLDLLPYHVAASIDIDGDGYPDTWNANCDLACQAASGLYLDQFPDSSAASLDTDGDGYPDTWNANCDLACQAASGLYLDQFPDSSAASLDTDGDGYPDAWNVNCDLACEAASGLELDQLPNNPSASIDTDGDGYPDAWNAGCNVACQSNSGLYLDGFPSNPAAGLDVDGDGLPDAWNTNCDLTCQNASGLTLDAYPNDYDNDGLPDHLDPDNTADNGKPVIIAVPEDMHVAATGLLTLVALAPGDLVAYDVVSSDLTLEVFLAGQKLILDENLQVALPTGGLKLQWVAIDESGNRSEPADQVVNVYPQVSFAAANVLTGEASLARLPLAFTGLSPIYPLVLEFAWLESEGTANAGDVDTSEKSGVDLTNLRVTIHNDEELENAALMIPVLNDNVFEDDETLVFVLTKALVGENEDFELSIEEEHARVELTITDMNLAPSVEIRLMQAEVQTNLVDINAGEVSIMAIVTDPNGKDEHSFSWRTDELPVVPDNVATFSFDPSNLHNGDYRLAVSVTDNGTPPLSSEEVEFVFRVTSQSEASSSSNSSTASSVVTSSVPNVNSSASSSHSSTASSLVASSVPNVSSSAKSSSTSSSPSGVSTSSVVGGNLSSSAASVSSSGRKSGGGGGSSAPLLLVVLWLLAMIRRTQQP